MLTNIFSPAIEQASARTLPQSQEKVVANKHGSAIIRRENVNDMIKTDLFERARTIYSRGRRRNTQRASEII